MSSRVLSEWRPDDESFWRATGKRIAWRNLAISTYSLHLSFAVWALWSVIVVYLPQVGFEYTTSELFLLTALPSLSGATGRIVYSFVVPVFGGRRWTTFATATLLVPAAGLGFALQDASTPFWVMALLATAAGFGSANFSSSMDNISYFFPEESEGTALGINGGIGNVGVSVAQAVVPIVITVGTFGAVGGDPLPVVQGDLASDVLYLQNAGFLWVPFILIGCVASYVGMNDLESVEANVREQLVVVKRKHNWIMCCLYLGTFGSYIGYSFAFPLLVDHQFTGVEVATFAFVGPLLGAVIRAPGGWLADRLGGARVTLAVFAVMAVALAGVIFALQQGVFWLFFVAFVLLFVASGVGNGSTFEMIPTIFRHRQLQQVDGDDPEARERAISQAELEAGSVLGVSSGIGAYGGFLIPHAFSTSLDATGGTLPALGAFLAFYVTCVALTWYYYQRPNAEAPC